MHTSQGQNKARSCHQMYVVHHNTHMPTRFGSAIAKGRHSEGPP